MKSFSLPRLWRLISRPFRAGCACSAASLAFAAPLLAQTAGPQPDAGASPTATFIQRIEDTDGRLTMTVNTSRRLTLATRIKEVQINNPEVLNVTPLSPTEVQVFARGTGVTQLNLFPESGEVHTIDVLVLGDAQEVQVMLARLFPRSNLQVVPFASSALVTGYVDDATQVTTIMQIVQEYFPTAIDAIKVGGVQQVQLYVKVMEVSRTKLRQLGVDFAGITPTGDFFGSGISGLLQMGGLTTGTVASRGVETFSYGIVDGGSTSFFSFLDALQQRDLAKILAEPKLVTVSGRPAYFNAGGEIPILVPQSLGTVSIQYRPYGTQVDFVPIIRDNGVIRLEVRPRVSEIDNARSVVINNINVPALRVREIDTGVEMRAGQTLAIAGLVQTRVESINRGLPWISDVPYLGVPFRRVREQENDVELLIIVTPQLVAAVDGSQALSPVGPGGTTCSPNDCELYLKGELEVPCCPPRGTCMQEVPGLAPLAYEGNPAQVRELPVGEAVPVPPAVDASAAPAPTTKPEPTPPAPAATPAPIIPQLPPVPAPQTNGGAGAQPKLPGLVGASGYGDLR